MSETFKKITEEYAKLRIVGILVENKKDKKTPQEIAGDIVQMLQADCHFVIEEK
jgi:hypothetical protein